MTDFFVDPKLNVAEVEAVAALNSTIDEIAAYFDVSTELIEEFYMANVKRGWFKGKIKVRQMIMDRAEKDKDQRSIDFIVKHFLGGESGKR